jgi:hypothetical protein
LGETPLLEAAVRSITLQRASIQHVIAAPAVTQEHLQQWFPDARVVPDQGKIGGLYGAINAALAGASSDWTWFTYLNDDDLLTPCVSDMLFRHLDSGAREGVIYGDVDLIDEAGKPISRITTERSPGLIPALLQEEISPLMQHGTLFRRDVVERLGGFDTRYRLCADLDFWLRAYVGGAGFRHYGLRVAQFRLRAGQLSGATATTEREQLEIVRRHLPQPLPLVRRRYARWRYRILNLPRYVARIRARGWRTSYQVLQQGALPR